MAPSGGAEKNLNMDAQLQIIRYKKPQISNRGFSDFLPTYYCDFVSNVYR